MKNNLAKLMYFQSSSIRQVVEFILIVVILNYMTTKMESVSDAMINYNFINSQTNKRDIFHSMNAIHLVQKGIVYCLCRFILKGTRYILESKQQNTENYHQRRIVQSNDSFINYVEKSSSDYLTTNTNSNINSNNFVSFQLTSTEEIFLGIATFASIKAFMSLQSVFNVIYIIVSKYSNFLFIVIVIHFVILYSNGKKDEKLFTKNNCTKILKDLRLAVPVGTGIILIKLLMTEIPSFFRSYSGKSPQQSISLSDLMIGVLALALDYVLYIGLFLIKQKYAKKIKNDQSNIYCQPQIRKQLRPIVFLSSWTKYTVLILFGYNLVTGEFFYLIGFIWNHFSITFKLIEISIYYFVSQWITCKAFLKYRAHVFISVIMTSGMFSKTYFHLFKNINFMTVPYLMVLIGMFLMIIQAINEQNQSKKNAYFPSTFCKTSQIKEYDFLNVDQKSTDYQQQGIDLVTLPIELTDV